MPRLLGWLFLGCLLLVTSTRLFADGGMVLLHRENPPFVVTVFGSPTPLRAGAVDLSVLVQSSETIEPVLDADVRFELTKGESELQVQATRERAQNKLLYVASVRLDEPGEWHYSVWVRGARDASTPVAISGVIAVAPEQPKVAAYGSYLALPFLLLAIFALHQRLRWRQREGTATAPANEICLGSQHRLVR